MNKYKFFSIFFIIFFFAFSMMISPSENDIVRLKLGSYSIDIPKKNSLEQGIPSWLSWLPGLDNSTEQIMFTVSAEDISRELHGYRISDGDYQEDIRGLLSVLNSSEIEGYTSSAAYLDLWNSTGSYSSRRVEPFGNELYKVYREIEYPNSWALVSQSPEQGGRIPSEASEFWLAHCLSGNSSETASGHHVTCRSHVVFNDLLIEFNISEQNITELENLKSYLTEEIQKWIEKV